MAFVFKYLPEEIMTDILSRVPLKYLVQCKSVAKPWLQFLTFSHFPYDLLERHISCDPLQPCPHNQSYIILTFDTHGYIDSRRECKLLSIGGGTDENSFKTASEMNSPFIKRKTSYQIKTACCNGMLCVAIDDDNSLALWNPSTGDHKTIPVPVNSGIRGRVCGLGFDPTTDDYKVVSIFDKTAVHVFSVKTNTWKRIPNLRFPYFVFNEGIPINGCIYWSASKSYKFGDVIIKLNLTDLRLIEIPVPKYDVLMMRRRGRREEDYASYIVIAEVNLLTWGNSLCAYRQFDQTVWTLKEEKDEGELLSGGIRYIWTQRMTLPEITYYDDQYLYHYRLQPKCFTKNGKLVVFVKQKRYVLFDGTSYEELNVQGLDDGFHTSVVYTESLISPNSVRSLNNID